MFPTIYSEKRIGQAILGKSSVNNHADYVKTARAFVSIASKNPFTIAPLIIWLVECVNKNKVHYFINDL